MNSFVRGLGQYAPYAAAVVVIVAIANIVPALDDGGEAHHAAVAAAEVKPAPTPPMSTVAISTPPPLAAVHPAAMPITPSTTTTTDAPAADAAPTRLTIVASGYATAPANVSDPAVPDNGLPVSAGAAGPSRISVVRLSGSSTVLALVLVPDDAVQRLPELADVVACPITEDWQPARGMPMADAPAYDCTTGVTAQRANDTTFTFDLSTYSSPTAGYGFALVPGADAHGFHVTFSINTVAAPSGGGES